MKKYTDFIVIGTVIILYQVVAFVPEYERHINFGQAYILTMITVITAFVIYKWTYRNNSNLQSGVYKFPIIKKCFVGSLTQIGLSVCFFVLGDKIPTWIESIILISILSMIIISTTVMTKTVEMVEQIETKEKKQIVEMTLIKAKINSIYQNCTDEAIRQIILEIVEKINYSDPISNAELSDIELLIKDDLDKLEEEVEKRNVDSIKQIVEKITKNINKRNILCKMTK